MTSASCGGLESLRPGAGCGCVGETWASSALEIWWGTLRGPSSPGLAAAQMLDDRTRMESTKKEKVPNLLLGASLCVCPTLKELAPPRRVCISACAFLYRIFKKDGAGGACGVERVLLPRLVSQERSCTEIWEAICWRL